MRSEGADFDGSTRRLHPVSPLFRVGSAARALLLPGIFVLFASRGSNWEVWMMLLFIPAVIGNLVEYWAFRYRLAGDEMIVREGIVTRNERHVPYARIQNIDLRQNPFHRIFGVAEVRVETAGGQKPEAVMRVLSLEAVEQMRAAVFAGRAPGELVPAEENSAATDEKAAVAPLGSQPRVVHRLSPIDVALFGVISNKGMVLVAAALGMLWQTSIAERWRDTIDPRTLEKIRVVLPLEDKLGFGFLVLAAVLVFLAVVRLLSVVWAFLQFHGFHLSQVGDNLRAQHGLFTRITKTVPRRRIQVLSTRRGPLHRWLGRVGVQVQTAGGGASDEGASTGRVWLAPLIRDERVGDLLREALPGIDPDLFHWQPICPRARRRIVMRGLYWLVPLTGLTVWLRGPWAFAAALPLLGWLILHAQLYVRHAAWAVIPGAVAYRSGWWNRRMSVARFGKIQALEMWSSPFDRRRRMASLRVDTAGSGGLGHGVEIRYLDAPVATELMARLSNEAGRTQFQW